MRMRRSLAELEREFARESRFERDRRSLLQRSGALRRLKRESARRRKRGSRRFLLLVATLIVTAVAVTVAMFTTLYLLLG